LNYSPNPTHLYDADGREQIFGENQLRPNNLSLPKDLNFDNQERTSLLDGWST